MGHEIERHAIDVRPAAQRSCADEQKEGAHVRAVRWALEFVALACMGHEIERHAIDVRSRMAPPWPMGRIRSSGSGSRWKGRS